MSWSAQRAAIAAALSTLDDVNGYVTRPSTAVPGDAWVLFNGLDRSDTGLPFINWIILVMLPQSDEASAQVWTDDHLDVFLDGLPVAGAGYVDRIDPVNVSTGTGIQYGLQITMRSE